MEGGGADFEPGVCLVAECTVVLALLCAGYREHLEGGGWYVRNIRRGAVAIAGTFPGRSLMSQIPPHV